MVLLALEHHHLVGWKPDPRDESGAVRAPAALAMAVRGHARRKAGDELHASAHAAAVCFIAHACWAAGWRRVRSGHGIASAAVMRDVLCDAKPLAPGEEQVVLVARAADHGEPDLLRDLVSHLGEPRARYQERNAHLRGLDHHLGRETA